MKIGFDKCKDSKNLKDKLMDNLKIFLTLDKIEAKRGTIYKSVLTSKKKILWYIKKFKYKINLEFKLLLRY